MPQVFRRSKQWCFILALALALSAFAGTAKAGTQHIPMGLGDIMAGVLPPPGFYWLNYLIYAQKDALLDEDGDEQFATPGGRLDSDFKADVWVEAARFVWMSPFKIFGANYGAQVIFPVYSANAILKLDPPGPGTVTAFNSSDRALGDITINPLILAWHFSPNFHAAFGLDIAVPSGAYDADEPTSTLLNKNHFTFEPLVAISYWKPGGIDLSTKIMYDIHTPNYDFAVDPSTATSLGRPGLIGRRVTLKPGQEFHIDLAASHALGKEDFRLGLIGFYYQQVTADRVNGEKLDSDTKSRQAAIGGAFKWWPGMGKFSITAKYLKELEGVGRNVANGQSFWIDTIYAF